MLLLLSNTAINNKGIILIFMMIGVMVLKKNGRILLRYLLRPLRRAQGGYGGQRKLQSSVFEPWLTKSADKQGTDL